jgi:hypothetical protein
MRSNEQDKAKRLALLKKDLINGPYHCFRYHSNCSPDFCRAARRTHADNSNNQPMENEESTAESKSDDEMTMYMVSLYSENQILLYYYYVNTYRTAIALGTDYR